MSYMVSFEKKDRFLHVRVSGENTPDNVRAYLREVYQACAEFGVPAVLVEENLRGQALDPVDVYRIIAEPSAQTAPVIQRIAYVDLNSERSEANITLGEAVARDHGVNVRVFPTVAAAEQWLAAELGIS
jgi:ABC-type lipoprotein release transport system permease subunit